MNTTRNKKKTGNMDGEGAQTRAQAHLQIDELDVPLGPVARGATCTRENRDEITNSSE